MHYPRINALLASFEPATVDEVRKIIMCSPNKSCDLDPLPTTLLKACLDTLFKPLTDKDASLCSGLFPYGFNHAHVNPLLKKTYLPKEDLNSFIHVYKHQLYFQNPGKSRTKPSEVSHQLKLLI